MSYDWLNVPGLNLNIEKNETESNYTSPPPSVSFGFDMSNIPNVLDLKEPPHGSQSDTLLTLEKEHSVLVNQHVQNTSTSLANVVTNQHNMPNILDTNTIAENQMTSSIQSSTYHESTEDLRVP